MFARRRRRPWFVTPLALLFVLVGLAWSEAISPVMLKGLPVGSLLKKAWAKLQQGSGSDAGIERKPGSSAAAEG